MDDNGMQEIDEQQVPDPSGSTGPVGFPWGGVLLCLWAVALIVFSVQNAEPATIEFLVWEWYVPIALVVMITALATLVIAAIGSAIYRRRRRRRVKTET